MSLPPNEPRRIASFVPATTELLFVLDAWDRVVGVSHECDFPPQAGGLPRLTRTRVDARGPAGQLNAAVQDLAARGQGLFDLDRDRLRELKPDLLVVQTNCDVCAVSPEDVRAIQEELRPRPELYEFGPRTYEELLAEIRRLGAVLHRPDAARREILKQWGLAKEIRNRTHALDRPRVAVLDWVDPVMFAGHWTQELVEMAGGEYGLVAQGRPSRWGSWDELEEYEPDVILATPCGRTLEQAADELAAAVRTRGLWDLAATEQGRLFVADGNHYFNRPGPRLVYAAALLARALHWDDVPSLPAALESGLGRLEVPRTEPRA